MDADVRQAFQPGRPLAHAHDALRAAILYALYGSISLGLAARWRRVEFAYLGVSLLAAVPVWWLVRLAGIVFLGPVWALTLAVEALVMGTIAMGLNRFARFRRRETTGRERPPRRSGGKAFVSFMERHGGRSLQKPLPHVAETVGVLSGLLTLVNHPRRPFVAGRCRLRVPRPALVGAGVATRLAMANVDRIDHLAGRRGAHAAVELSRGHLATLVDGHPRPRHGNVGRGPADRSDSRVGRA